MFSCFTFSSTWTIKNAMTALIIQRWQTSNSLIWTSCGRMWLNWLNVLTATVSPLCLLTPCNRGQSNILTSGYTTNQYLENCSSSSLAKHTGCAPDVVCRTPQERHFPTELLWADSFSVCGHWRFIRGIFTESRWLGFHLHSLITELPEWGEETAADGPSVVIHSWRNRWCEPGGREGDR